MPAICRASSTRGGAGEDAEPVVADVEVDQDVHPDPRRLGRLGQQLGLAGMADGQHAPRPRRLASATIRAILPGSTIGEVRRTPVIPAATIASASGTVATATPRAPAATCRRAISGHLCVLACGRAAQPRLWQCSAIIRMLASKASRSSSRAGVGMSALVQPTAGLRPRPRPRAGRCSAWQRPARPQRRRRPGIVRRFEAGHRISSPGRLGSTGPAGSVGLPRSGSRQAAAARPFRSQTTRPSRSVSSHSSFWVPVRRRFRTSRNPKSPVLRPKTARSATAPTPRWPRSGRRIVSAGSLGRHPDRRRPAAPRATGTSTSPWACP